MPAERLRNEKLTEDQFREMLEQRSFDEEAFVRLVLEQSRKHPGDEAMVWVIRILEQGAPPPPTAEPDEEPDGEKPDKETDPDDVEKEEPAETED